MSEWFGALEQTCLLFAVVGPMWDPLLYEVHQVQQWSEWVQAGAGCAGVTDLRLGEWVLACHGLLCDIAIDFELKAQLLG